MVLIATAIENDAFWEMTREDSRKTGLCIARGRVVILVSRDEPALTILAQRCFALLRSKNLLLHKNNLPTVKPRPGLGPDIVAVQLVLAPNWRELLMDS
jgi:hypothetical protein